MVELRLTAAEAEAVAWALNRAVQVAPRRTRKGKVAAWLRALGKLNE